jgi:hypothetical protein
MKEVETWLFYARWCYNTHTAIVIIPLIFQIRCLKTYKQLQMHLQPKYSMLNTNSGYVILTTKVILTGVLMFVSTKAYKCNLHII